jgi:hypothetical protein
MGSTVFLVLVLCCGGAYLAHMGGWWGLAGALLCVLGGFGFGHEALKSSLGMAGYALRLEDGKWRVGRVKATRDDLVEWM